jgi:hypothetical protein
MHPSDHICEGEKSISFPQGHSRAHGSAYIDRHVVVLTQDDLGGAVETRLDICIDCIAKHLGVNSKATDSMNVTGLPFSFSKQLLPKSMTLTPLLDGWRRRMFCEHAGQSGVTQPIPQSNSLRA